MFARKFYIWGLLVIVLVAGLVVPFQPTLAATDCKAVVNVRPGNTLAGFAQKYDVRFEDLAKAREKGETPPMKSTFKTYDVLAR